ncbi:unnamed protein product [Prorocentrum cordatum]|uniref:peptidylprolyl isomerase n=1 Tax=Prorocentrum cordatum TaxID=2364126 RepID=A0ABN9XK57_9DINO|nr:unnamed protein product [Polarella glacialis]
MAAQWPNFEAARVEAVEACLLEQRVSDKKITWRTALNDHASTRPQVCGGALVPAVSKCKECAAPGAGWRRTLTLPNSFAPGDGRRLVAIGESAMKEEASELACLRAVASLVSENPGQFVLRPKRWKVPPDELVASMHGAAADPASGGHALPALTRLTLARLVELASDVLRTRGGEFDPSRISRNKWWRRDERAFETFNELLAPGGLKDFLDRHSDEFAWREQADNRGMFIAWANWARREERAPPWARPAMGEVGAGATRHGTENDAEMACTMSVRLLRLEPLPSSERLAVETVSLGDGETFPRRGDRLTMHYVGKLASTGVQFDSSRERGEPFRCQIGVRQVIAGWDYGVMKMSLGERAILRHSVPLHCSFDLLPSCCMPCRCSSIMGL